MSPNHRIWATTDIRESAKSHLVYLMYRKDLGFRVGVTKNGRTELGRRSCVNRMTLESADSIWFLDRVEDYEQALLLETSYSLEYGVPTCVFNGQYRDLNQERLNALFDRFGQNGLKLLAARYMDPQLPHWNAYASSNGRIVRRTIQMLAHHSKGTLVSFEWSGGDLHDKLSDVASIVPAKGTDRWRIRKYCNSYRAGLSFAALLQERTGAQLNRRLSLGLLEEEPLQLINASGLFVGMQVATLDGTDLDIEEVTSVERVEAKFVDLDIDDASNFFGGGILSHNCINGFQGAKPALFKDLYQKEGWKTRTIRTNYRCEPEIVDAANSLIANNEGNIPIPQVPSPDRKRGVGSIQVSQPDDEAESSLSVVTEIKQSHVLGGDYTDNAVLCRTNKEIHAYETACIIRGVPYARRGSGSFLGSPETKAVLGYVQLVTGTDFTKAQAALGQVINNPRRFFLADNSKAPAIVEAAFVQYSRMKGMDVKSIDPRNALKDRAFQAILAEGLARNTRTGKGFKFEQRIEDLGYSLDEMRARSKEESYKTKDLLDDILGLEGVKIDNGAFVAQSFRDSLSAFVRDGQDAEDAGDETEEEDNPTKGLGNVSFLYQLAEPDPTDEDDDITPPSTPSGFAAKMSRYASKMRDLRTDIDKWTKDQSILPPEQRRPPPGVFLSTVHATKGAQWATTFVQMPAGKFPMEIKTPPGEEPPPPEKEAERMEDERRLAYVAVTRAAKNLRIVCPKRVGGKPAGVSSFVSEAGLYLGENVKDLELKPPVSPAVVVEDEGPDWDEGDEPEAKIREASTNTEDFYSDVWECYL